MVLLLNLCPSYLWLLRLGFQKKKCLHSILDVDWLCLSFCLFLIFVLGFVGNPIMKRKQKKCVFWPQHYYTLVIRPQISPHRPHLTYWLGSGVPSHHALNMIFPLISPSWREATVGHRQPKTDRSKVFSFDVRTPRPAPSLLQFCNWTWKPRILTCTLRAGCSNHWCRNIRGRRQLK